MRNALRLTIPVRSSDPAPSPNSKEAHKGEGLLKSAWHRLTHQHDNLVKDDHGVKDDGKEEPKRASGSG